MKLKGEARGLSAGKSSRSRHCFVLVCQSETSEFQLLGRVETVPRGHQRVTGSHFFICRCTGGLGEMGRHSYEGACSLVMKVPAVLSWRCLQSCHEGACSLVLVTEHLPRLWIVCVKQGWSEKSGPRASASCGERGWGGMEGREGGSSWGCVSLKEKFCGRRVCSDTHRSHGEESFRRLVDTFPCLPVVKWEEARDPAQFLFAASILHVKWCFFKYIYICTAHSALCVTYHVQLITVTRTVECKSNISKERSHRDFPLLVLLCHIETSSGHTIDQVIHLGTKLSAC